MVPMVQKVVRYKKGKLGMKQMRFPFAEGEEEAQLQALVVIAITCLGRIALQRSGHVSMSTDELLELYQSLFDLLEVLNDKKELNDA